MSGNVEQVNVEEPIVKECKLDNGLEYILYVPENVNEDTPVFIYTHGAGGKQDIWSKWNYAGYSAGDYATEQGSDAIIIAPVMYNGKQYDWVENSLEIINHVKEEYGVTNNNVTTAGFSAGGFNSLNTLTNNIKANSDLEPQVGFLVDDYSVSYNHISYVLADENMRGASAEAIERTQLLKDNNAVLFILESQWKEKGKSNSAYMSELGINVVRVICEDANHVHINNNFFKNGFVDFYTGKNMLPSEGYTYQVYNQETGEWEDVNINDIGTLEKLYDYFGIDPYRLRVDSLKSISLIDLGTVNSDDRFLMLLINNVLFRVKSTSFLNSGIGSFSGASTSKIPVEVSAVVEKFYASNVDLLTKIADDMKSFSNIGASIVLLDNELSDIIQSVGSSPVIYEEE